MPLGGGTFTTQNKTMPGSYMNFVSSTHADEVLGDRGIVAIPLELDWGNDSQVFTVNKEDFANTAKVVFGYEYSHSKLKGIRDLFKYAIKVHFYRMRNAGDKATCTYADAKYYGTRGNDLKVVVATNVDDSEKFDVTTLLDNVAVDLQTVADAAGLEDNDYLVWKDGVALANTAGVSLTGGSNGSAITGTQYQAALDAFEAISFDVLGCLSTDDTIKDVFIAYTKRLRDENGIKFQTVVYKRESANHEGIISVENTVSDSGALASSLVFWLCGASAGVAINESITNKLYDGEFTINTNFTQSALEAGISAGKLMFHNVSDTVRVLTDINTLVTYTEEKTKDFASNQIIRVIDQIANDIASIFNSRYLGLKPNDNASRISLWNEIVTHHRELESTGAIEGFNANDITVTQGADKKSVIIMDYITPTNAMEQLYMTVIVQ